MHLLQLPAEKVYSVSLTGYNRLKEDRQVRASQFHLNCFAGSFPLKSLTPTSKLLLSWQAILSDLALSDYNLQDAIIGADSTEVSEREVDGQTFVDFDLYGFFGAYFVTVTVYGGRIYAVFSVVPDT